MQAVRFVAATEGAERVIGYCARVSNPSNQDNPSVAKLLAYCIKHAHWSIFEMATMTLEIVTTRTVGAQILRHRSFSFQEFSQRYAQAQDYVQCEARRQDDKNRQNSIDDLSSDDKVWFINAQSDVWEHAKRLYDLAIRKGIAKECARMLLPLNTQTTMYMTGSIRSWIHYIQLRSGNGTQAEHMEIANAAKAIFCEKFPDIAAALEWHDNPS
jgi:thymidylate synthase (FAD)